MQFVHFAGARVHRAHILFGIPAHVWKYFPVHLQFLLAFIGIALIEREYVGFNLV